MRDDLAQLYEAGIRKGRFSGRLQIWSRRGQLALDQIQSPTGDIDHCWIKCSEWTGPKAPPGLMVEFMGEIRPYFKGNGILEYGLFDCTVVRVLRR